MLEVKGLKKQYKPKKGAVVNALAGVDLLFPQKGMIFILGKSGSGKSTLLNLLGGLDTYDGGEIIIKGKSSKDFSQSEFDSYRNTYLGFIFQSYNVLDEFSVADNIALALELQNEKCSKQIIDNILEQVDLVGFGGRKPRELSGGQKQRVAIARALVKNPDIILADEPTGALDSNTGIAVFDTLKELSKDKLVIIVSHDREFAENYGDRVIEFKDGSIISDIVKYEVENKEISKGISLYENQAIQIKQGHDLTLEEFERIKKHIKESKQDVIISLNDRTTSAAKVAARITDEGSSEAFRDTKTEDILLKKNDIFRLKKSKLGLKNSVRIGASSLKVKPGRLMITILLSICAFTLFGTADTMGCYDGADVTYNSFIDNKVLYSGIQKYSVGENWNREIDITQDDLDKLEKDYNAETFPIYNEQFRFGENLQLNISAPYYTYSSDKAISITKDIIDDLGMDLEGDLPANINEVVITKYMYEHYEVGGYRIYDTTSNEELKYDINSYNDLIGKTINEKKVVGILDTKLDSEKYEDLKDTSSNSGMDAYTFQGVIQNDLHCTTIYHEDFFIEEEKEESLTTEANLMIFKNDLVTEYSSISEFFEFNYQSVTFFDENKTTLSTKEIVISYDSFSNMFYEDMNEASNSLTEEEKRNAITNYVEKNGYAKDWENQFSNNVYPQYPDGYNYENWDTATEETKEEWYTETWVQYLIDYGYNDMHNFDYLSGKQICNDLIMAKLNLSNLSTELNIYNVFSEAEEVKIVGVSTDLTYNKGIISTGYYKELKELIPASGYDSAIVIFPQDTTTLKKLVDFTYVEDKYTYEFTCSIQQTIVFANDYIEMFAEVFLYLGLFFAAFASLLLFNFISTSISYKQKEIGILRAIGARSKDVFGIFFSETLIIGAINFVVSCVAIFITSNVINTLLREQAGLEMSLLNPNIRQIILVLGVSLLVSFVSSFFPVYKIARKRPIESIRQG
ncbi:MAG: ATP-binding cassette domain-containing protein [bacterium]